MNKSNKWGALSMKGRAFLIRQAVKNGITDLGSIKEIYNHRFDGETDTSSKPLFNKEQIVRNVPAREWGPYTLDEENNKLKNKGTSGILDAVYHYNDNKNQLGKQYEDLARQIVLDLENTKPKTDYNIQLDPRYHSYEDAKHYLEHVEGLRKYLGLPYDTNIIKESKYKPTRLQGTNEKTYKFASGDEHRYWEAVDDMFDAGHKKHSYFDETLNEFTAYRDRDEKGDFISIYDEWDYNPAIRGGKKAFNKLIDGATGGKPFVIYDRIYLNDHFNLPKESEGSVFIKPVVITPENTNSSHQFNGLSNTESEDLASLLHKSYATSEINSNEHEITIPYKYTYPTKDLGRKLTKKNSVKDYVDLMYPIMQKEMAKNGYPMTNIDNVMRQMAQESNYGRDTRGNGFNYAGIKATGADKKEVGTKYSDGEYYMNFENNADFANWYLDLLNDRYDALNATSSQDYINRLHDGPYKYSKDKKGYSRNFRRMKTLDNILKTREK